MSNTTDPTLRHPNRRVVRHIQTLSDATLANLCGSDLLADKCALIIDWTAAILADDAPTFSTWGHAWEWYISRLAARYPDHIRLELAPEPARVAIVE